MMTFQRLLIFLITLAMAAGISSGTPAMTPEVKEGLNKILTITERTDALDLTSGNVSYTGGMRTGNPTANDILDSIEGWKWYLRGDAAEGYPSKTLVLEGINLSTADAKALIVPAGTTIMLKGANTVTSTYSDDASSYGLYACGSLTITGESDKDDILTVTGGNPSSKSTTTSFGLYVSGDLTMSGGRVDAIGGDSRFSRGISVNADLTMTGGSLYGRGGTASDGSSGLWLAADNAAFTLSGGTLSAAGGATTLGSSYGMYGSICTIKVTGGNFTAAGSTGKRNSFGVHILTRSVFTLSGGTAVLKGNDMGINIAPLITGSYEYKTNKFSILEPSENWTRGKIDNFLLYKYVGIRYDKSLKPEIELG